MHVVCLLFHPSVDSVAKMVGLLFFVVSVLIIASICWSVPLVADSLP